MRKEFSCRQRLCVVAAGMLVLAGCGTSQALTARASSPQAEEQQLKSLSLAELGQVRITSTSKQPEEVWRTPAPVFVLTSEDIRRSGATNLPDLLRMVPGVQVSRSQSDEWAVGIRGFASNFSKGLLVMIDGRSVYTPLFEGVYWDVQDLVLADIDRIEVIRGPAGAVWGLNAVNGIINIVTKDAKDTQGTMASALGGGAVERFIGEAQQGWRLPRQYLTARIYAKGFNRGPEINPGGNPYDTWHQERGGFRADWTPNARDHVTAEADVYQGESGGQNTIGRFFPPRQQIVQGGQPVSGGDFIVRWDRTLSASRNFYLEAYFDRTNRKTLQFGETRDTFDVDFVDHVGDLPRQDLIFGGGLRESPSNLVQLYRSVNFSPNQLTDYIYSGFVQDRIAIVPERLDAVLGTKIEDNNYSGVGVEPSARLLWTATPHRTLWAGVARALRIPGRLDQDLLLIGNAAPSPPTFVAIHGNPNFKPEVLISWEAGYRQLFGKSLYADVALFHNQHDNLESYGEPLFVITQPTNPYPYTQLNVTFANGIRGVTNGLELAPDWRPFDWWELRGTYSHTGMELHSKPGFNQAAYIATYEGQSPDHIATVQSLFTLPHGVHIDPDYRYMSALPANKIPGYQTADLHLSWKFARHLTLFGDGRNLLQPSHLEFPGDNGNAVRIRRSLYGGIRWTP